MPVTRSTASTRPSVNTGRRILLLSAYDAYSHQQWRDTLCDMFPDDQWTCLSLPPRHFAWRVRGNSLTWAFNHRQTLTDNYDLLVVTSLTDLSSLRGLVPALARLPTLVYFHENQFVYPARPTRATTPAADATQRSNQINAQITSLYTALCADHIAFNSDWNRRSFFDGLESLLSKLPDHVPPDLPQSLRSKSSVLPVPLPDQLFAGSFHNNSDTRRRHNVADDLQLVWNHRHEYDKGPELLLAIVRQLVGQGFPFRMHLLGQRFRGEPDEFPQIRSLLAAHYAHHNMTPGLDAWLPSRDEYEGVLSNSDIVLSTALHDFQGLSVLEAMARGCVPLAPAALAYPEYINPECLYSVAGLTVAEQAVLACEKITTWHRQWQNPRTCRPDIDIRRFSAGAMHEAWKTRMEGIMTGA